MSPKQPPLSQALWLKEGFILQSSKQEYQLGQGPFLYSSQASPQSLYHPDFFLTDPKPWLKPSLFWRAGKKELADFLFKGRRAETQSPRRLFQPSSKPSFVLYQQIFCQAQQAIQRGLFQKAVPALAESFASKPSPFQLIQAIFRKTHNRQHGFLYGAWNQKRGILGWTPEILFSVKGPQLFTMALAGTGPYPGPSLLQDAKELKEHNFVVQSLQESLKNLVKWEQKTAYEALFPPLQHLKTELKGRFTRSIGFEKLCQTLHPTAALGGYPPKQALDWLKSQPSQRDRIFFGAPFGFFDSDKKFFCLIALRALEWDEKKRWIFSGGGLVKESSLQKEWRELYLKREQVKSFFQ